MIFIIIIIDSLFQTYFISIFAFIIATISLILYAMDKFSIDLHITKARMFIEGVSDDPVEKSSKRNQFRITAQISNEGGRIAKDCYCYIQSSDKKQKEELGFVPIDTDAGRREPLPEKSMRENEKIELLPKKHIFARGYITIRENEKYQIFLTDGKRTVSLPDDPFRFPPWEELRKAQNFRREHGLLPIPF